MEQDFNKKHWSNPCPKYDCRNNACKCGLKYVSMPATLGDDSAGSEVAPKNGAYCNTVVKYEANGHVYVYTSEGIPTLVTEGCECPEVSPNLVVRLPNGMTTYLDNNAPITIPDALDAFHQGRAIFLVDDTNLGYSTYMVTAVDANDGIWSMKVEAVGVNAYMHTGFWQVSSEGNLSNWKRVEFFPYTQGGQDSVVNLSVVIDDDSWGTPLLAYHFGSGDDIGVAKLSAAQGNQGLFRNDDSGEFVTEGELYEMIASGARVKLNHVPVGQSLTSPHTSLLVNAEYVNGIELTNEFVTEVDGAPVNVYSATVPFLLYVSESGIYPPLGVFLQRTGQEAPYDDTYGFFVQGRFDGTNYD